MRCWYLRFVMVRPTRFGAGSSWCHCRREVKAARFDRVREGPVTRRNVWTYLECDWLGLYEAIARENARVAHPVLPLFCSLG